MKERRFLDLLRTEISSVPGLHLLAVRVSHGGAEERALVDGMHEVPAAAQQLRKQLQERLQQG